MVGNWEADFWFAVIRPTEPSLPDIRSLRITIKESMLATEWQDVRYS
jgi:hypothetical protein